MKNAPVEKATLKTLTLPFIELFQCFTKFEIPRKLNVLQCKWTGVVYFNQSLDAAHSKRSSKNAFSLISMPKS